MRRKSDDFPPTALNRKTSEIVRHNINKLFRRVLWFKNPELTNNDILHAFVSPELRDIALKAHQHFQVWSPRFSYTAPCGLTVRVEVSEPNFAYPKDIGRRTYDNASSQRIAEWAQWRLDIGLQWGMVEAVFDELNDRCPSPREVRFFWQPIVLLLGDHELAEKLRSIKAPEVLPPLPRELIRACEDTATTIAGACMLPDRDKTPEWPVFLDKEWPHPNTLQLPWNPHGMVSLK
jgi:hypothetical protein